MRDVWEELYRQHRQGLYSLALSVTGNADQAEDAIHDAFTRLFRHTGKPKGNPAAYMYMSVRNAAIDQIRRNVRDRQRRQSIYEQVDPAAVGQTHTPAHAALDTERQQAVRDAMDNLSDEQREVIVMKMYGGLTFEQIAESVGAPLSTITSRYRRGLDRLERGLQAWT